MSYRSGEHGPHSFRAQAPIEAEEEHEADVMKTSRGGNAGLAKIQGFVASVPNAKQGDHVGFKIIVVGNGLRLPNRLVRLVSFSTRLRYVGIDSH